MANLGLAFGQIDDMEAWYASLKTSGLLPEGAATVSPATAWAATWPAPSICGVTKTIALARSTRSSPSTGAGIGRFGEPLSTIMADFPRPARRSEHH
ncbi:MAG: hypothetical protein IPG34_12835 [Rhodocyclaceae bacterium]|nr:hypothetical protein [Rhodocyclaceae bacterium]